MTIDELTRGEAMINVHCPSCGWSNGGRLVVVDRYATDMPPGPRGSGFQFLEMYFDNWMDPDDKVTECDLCGFDLDPREVLEAIR